MLDAGVPEIKLVGLEIVNIALGDIYVDEGATAIDLIDGDITHLIETVSTVPALELTELGSYEVTYNVADTGNNHAVEVIRTVHVLPGKN